jgi:hypothetical protein
MRQVMGLSIFLSIILNFHVMWGANSTPVQAKNVVIPPLAFLEQAENVEREAWWVLSNKRVEGSDSPFRVFRAAASQYQKDQKSKIFFNFCKTLLVFNQAPGAWRIESGCQRPSIELGVIEKLSAQDGGEKWRMTWKNDPFAHHFGIGTTIFFPRQTCELEVDAKGRLRSMSCPNYVRDIRPGEVVNAKVFEYHAGAPQVLKLEGDVKKELQVQSTFKTEVPLTGDIVLKIKKVPQKAVEQKAEFSNMTSPVPTRGGQDGKKENDGEKGRKENDSKEINKEAGKEERQEDGQEISNEEKNNGEESRKENVKESSQEGGKQIDNEVNAPVDNGITPTNFNGDAKPNDVPAIEPPPPTR